MELIQNYLTNRKQVVKINDTYSEELTVEIGIPQGTILGPLLFIVFIDDLLRKDINGSIIAYADDTGLIIYGKNWKDLEKYAGIVLNDIACWLNVNGLTLNTDKTNYVIFSNNIIKRPNNFKIIIHKSDNCKDNCDCKPIICVDSTKYLGVIVDKNMKWHEQIDWTTKRLRYLIYVFANLKKILNINSLLTIYYALFDSIATYGIIAWGGAYKTALKSLQAIQNKILKIIFAVKANEIINVYINNRILNIKQNYYFKSLLNNYDTFKKKFKDLKSITRNKQLNLPKNKLEVGKKDNEWIGLNIFNMLPTNLKSFKKINKNIKNRLKINFCELDFVRKELDNM